MKLIDKAYKEIFPRASLVLLLLVGSLFYRLGSWGVIDTSEARYAEISRKMVESSDFIHPVYLGIEHYHKPPMTYWITSLSYKIFGATPFAARFFLQIAFLAQLILVFLIARKLDQHEKVAVHAAAIYGTLLIVLVSIRNLTTDAYLNTFLLASTYHAISYCTSTRSRHLYLFFVFGAFAFLTKITAVFVYLGPLILFCLWRYRGRVALTWHVLWAFLLGLLFSLSWFLILQMEGKDVLKYMLYDQSLVRYSSDTFNRSMPFYFYFAATLLLSVPWIFLAFSDVIKHFRIHKTLHPTSVLFFASFLLPILFFSLSQSKLLLYILPAFWILAIGAARQLNTLADKESIIWLRTQLIFHLLVLCGILLLPIVGEDFRFSPIFYVWWAIGTITILSIFFHRSLARHHKLVYGGLTFSISIVLISTHFLSGTELKASTGKMAVQWLQEKKLNSRPVYIFDKLAPSFPFHLGKDVALIGRSVKRELQFEQDDTWKNFYFDLEIEERKSELLNRLESSPSILVARKNRVHQIDAEIVATFSQQHDVGLWKIYF